MRINGEYLQLLSNVDKLTAKVAELEAKVVELLKDTQLKTQDAVIAPKKKKVE